VPDPFSIHRQCDTGIGGAHGGCGRELRDCDVVGMPVRTVRTESDDHVGPNAPDVRSYGANRNCGRELINFAVRVIQDRDLADTQHRGSLPQLRFTNTAGFNRVSGFSE
jgi:hypothetical protein